MLPKGCCADEVQWMPSLLKSWPETIQPEQLPHGVEALYTWKRTCQFSRLSYVSGRRGGGGGGGEKKQKKKRKGLSKKGEQKFKYKKKN